MFSLAILHFFSPWGAGAGCGWSSGVCALLACLRGWEAGSLLSLIQHQEPLTPCDITEQFKSCAHTFLLQPPSSHLPNRFLPFSFNRPLVLRLGYGLTALKLKRISSIKSRLLSIHLSTPSQVSLGETAALPILTEGSQSALTLAVLFPLLTLPTWPLILLIHLFLKNTQTAENPNSSGDITYTSSIYQSIQCLRKQSATVRHLESKTCWAK